MKTQTTYPFRPNVTGVCSCYRTVSSSVCEIFAEFLLFCNLFHKPALGKWNKSKKQGKKFANIANIDKVATCDNYFIVKCFRPNVASVMLLPNCIELT